MDNNVDYVIYCDTDSLFVNVGLFLDNNIGTSWHQWPDEDIKIVIRNISAIIQNYTNDCVYKEMQRKSYNSNIEDFRIQFKQEMIAKTGLLVRKKRYAFWLIEEDRSPKDEISTTGLEIVRSDTPEIIRPMLKEILGMILKGLPDNDISEKIDEYKIKLMNCSASDIAVNIGAHNIDKYLSDSDKFIKGTPWHIKGVGNYRSLLKKLDISDKYAEIIDESKVKTVYLKKNAYNMETVSFNEWPKEFDTVLQIDYERMVENFFIDKLRILLVPMNKENLLNGINNKALSFFFS